MKEISSGAEALIFLERNQIIKERVPKRYRLKQLDEELRKSRTRRETKILQKVKVPAPKLFESDNNSKIVMEYLEGEQLKQLLDKKSSLAKSIGEAVATLHDQNIIHGDLTTSNMIFSKNKIHFIDFGLSFTSHSVEDKAVDLHLFKQALESKHHTIANKAYKEFLKGYKHSKNAESILQRLTIVERRGRNKAKW